MNLDWSTALGKSEGALTDGGKWPFYADFSGLGLLEVVTGGPNGKNALRIQQRGEHSANLQTKLLLPQSKDFSVSFWFKNDDTSPEGDHSIVCDLYKYINLIYIRKYSNVTNWYFTTSAWITDAEYRYPISYWRPFGTLEHGKWYRITYDIHFVDLNHIQIHPKVFNESGILLFDDKSFIQSDYLSTPNWNGRNDWTLELFYNAGYNFHIDPVQLQQFSVGNNGQKNALDTGKYWYVADVILPDVPSSGITKLVSGTYEIPGGSKLIVP